VPSSALPLIYNKWPIASKEGLLWEPLRLAALKELKDFEAAIMEHFSLFLVLETNIKKLCFYEKNL
jgi:hypothetical protein